MKAQIKPRIDLLNRTRLETVIPINVPFIINVDPADTCNFQCKFCPTGNRALMKKTPGRNHGIMDFELYKKIIDDNPRIVEALSGVEVFGVLPRTAAGNRLYGSFVSIGDKIWRYLA